MPEDPARVTASNATIRVLQQDHVPSLADRLSSRLGHIAKDVHRFEEGWIDFAADVADDGCFVQLQLQDVQLERPDVSRPRIKVLDS
ncbi:hypothetical protein RMR21_023110 (plasmid) [Agrobacterium sp. rho-8.1]|nr:hypothetical protein [Agrobacterium sp. rho-8.1]